jgi:hypothetical protein
MFETSQGNMFSGDGAKLAWPKPDWFDWDLQPIQTILDARQRHSKQNSSTKTYAPQSFDTSGTRSFDG